MSAIQGLGVLNCLSARRAHSSDPKTTERKKSCFDPTPHGSFDLSVDESWCKILVPSKAAHTNRDSSRNSVLWQISCA